MSIFWVSYYQLLLFTCSVQLVTSVYKNKEASLGTDDHGYITGLIVSNKCCGWWQKLPIPSFI